MVVHMEDKHTAKTRMHTEPPERAFKKGDVPEGINPADERPFVVVYTPETDTREIIAVLNPSTPDRTDAIKGLAPSPIPFLRNSFDMLHNLGAETAGIACNTMHYWFNRQMDENPDSLHPNEIVVAHMIEGTAKAIAASGIKTVGLLATTGTANTELYQDVCRAKGISVITLGQKPKPDSEWLDAKGRVTREFYLQYGVDKETGAISGENFLKLEQALQKLLGPQEGLVMESIYGVFGIKAGFATGVARRLMETAATMLVSKGAYALILGCTEVPLVLEGKTKQIAGKEVALIDTTQVVADRLVAAGKDGKVVGIAGGLGPAATIDMLQKMGVDRAATDYIRCIYQETIIQLRNAGIAITDREHVKLVFIQTKNYNSYLQRIQQLNPLFIETIGGREATSIRGLVQMALQAKWQVTRRGKDTVKQ